MSGPSSLRIAAVGDNCIDEYVEPVGRRFAGGNAYNVAVRMAKLGFAVDYMGAVGDDADGHALRAVLEREGVSVDRLRVLPGRTAVTSIELRDGGERVFLHEDFGVVAEYRPSDEDLEVAAQSAFVHGAVIQGLEGVLAALAAAGARVSYDFSTTDPPSDLSGLDVAFFSARPGVEPAAIARTALAAGARAAIVTLGAGGSLAAEGLQLEKVAAVPVQPADTTGAGDAYIAAFLAARLEARPLRLCMTAASEAAARACVHLGGTPRAELLAFSSERSTNS